MIIKEKNRLFFDSAGRVCLSREERAEFNAEVVVAGNQHELFFMTEGELRLILAGELSNLKGLDLRRKRRALFARAFIQTIDQQGRVLIPFRLRRLLLTNTKNMV